MLGGGVVKTAVIILFHGSREERAAEAADRIVAAVTARGGYDVVERAFLQYAKPDLHASVERCVRQGAGRIVVVPFFMQTGTHATTDVPRVLRELRARHPGVIMAVSDAVGTHPLMVEVVADLVRKSIAERGGGSAG
jgi:sirohydrochlorin ferrochelatase